jgi:hypothetical protein
MDAKLDRGDTHKTVAVVCMTLFAGVRSKPYRYFEDVKV